MSKRPKLRTLKRRQLTSIPVGQNFYYSAGKGSYHREAFVEFCRAVLDSAVVRIKHLTVHGPDCKFRDNEEIVVSPHQLRSTALR